MWNYEAIDKTPTVNQVKSIIDYMIEDKEVSYNFNLMMVMKRPKPNIVILELTNAHRGNIFRVVFGDDGEIKVFEKKGMRIS